MINGIKSISSDNNIDELKISIRFITFTWSCTKSFWFLKPMDYYYPLKVE